MLWGYGTTPCLELVYFFPLKSPCILDFVNKTSIKYLQHQDVTICYFFVCYVVTGLGDLLLAVFSVAAAQIIKKEI